MTQPQLSDILQQPIDGATRLLVRHERTRTFRWLGLVEFVVLMVGFCCIVLPLVVIAWAFADGDLDITGSGPEFISWDRLHHFWHDLVFTAIDADGEPLVKTRVRITDEAEGDALLAAILSAADRQAIMVVESVGAKTAATTQLWYGGRPLLAGPKLPTSDRITRRLETQGGEVSRDGRRQCFRFYSPSRSRFWPTVQLLAFVPGFPLLLHPILRRAARSAWLEWRGHGRPAFTVSVQPETITLRDQQGPVVFDELRLPNYRVLGFAWSPELTYGSKAAVTPPRLRAALEDGFARFPLPEGIGPDVRDFLSRETLDMRSRHPEAGLPHGDAPPTRCPYCGALYVFQPGTGCPGCGGWPDKIG